MRSQPKIMRQEASLAKERLVQGIALAVLLLMGAFVIAGPSGIIAWTENQHLLEERRVKLAELRLDRDRLKNRVNLLDQRRVDPDLAGELLRSNLNVARPDEMVMLIGK
ncbi:FtsB family cell division protein [Novosphingobium aerophilum]|uniref:FtsB family cell division protein n=1 Tax=Novosphingobium TaxID=165696 RepID=UPI0010E81D3B|nr:MULTISPECIES: septum formation initiator [unclassified Novosphingobium]TCM32525.1 septum formation initiator [Novosphingobium sp. ST904]WRT91804.1 septum formation initiator [Novosphingobium sp. RL4]